MQRLRMLFPLPSEAFQRPTEGNGVLLPPLLPLAVAEQLVGGCQRLLQTGGLLVHGCLFMFLSFNGQLLLGGNLLVGVFVIGQFLVLLYQLLLDAGQGIRFCPVLLLLLLQLVHLQRKPGNGRYDSSHVRHFLRKRMMQTAADRARLPLLQLLAQLKDIPRSRPARLLEQKAFAFLPELFHLLLQGRKVDGFQAFFPLTALPLCLFQCPLLLFGCFL